MALFCSASIHQGDEIFSVESRGKQCAFMSLSAILTAQNSSLVDWSESTLNNVLLQGDKMYLNALNNGLLVLYPGVEFLSIDNLPTVVNVASNGNGLTFEICQSANLKTHEQTPLPVMATLEAVEAQTIISLPIVVEPVKGQTIIDPPIVVEPVETQTIIDPPIVVEPVEAQTIIDPPIVVEPVEAQTIIDPPIVVEPVEAQTIIHPSIVVEPVEAQTIIDPPIVVEPVEAQTIIDPPIVVEPVEAQSIPNVDISAKANGKTNENQIWFINYGKEYQGLVIIDREIESHYFNIHTALLNTFSKNSSAILILEGYMVALIKYIDAFFLIESHARNFNGMPDSNGIAVVMKFNDILDLEQHLYFLSIELHTNLFEIVPVQLIACGTDNTVRCRKQKNSEYQKRKRSEETDSDRDVRLQKAKVYKKRKVSEETDDERQKRLEQKRESKKRKQLNETDSERQLRLQKQKRTGTRKVAQLQSKISQQDYLNAFDSTQNGSIEEQFWAKTNIEKFHKAIQYVVSQCTVCWEAWPLKSKPRSVYVCSRCSRDKKSPKKFSCENSMIPSYVPNELKSLTQVEEMLIARALPIMRVYIKPGGQRGYSGHCINLPQNVNELATSLPRYPKDLAVIIVKVKGRDNTFRDVPVRRLKVHNALIWLINNNPYYAGLTIDDNALNSLPENGVPPDLMTVETDEDIVSDNDCSPDLGPLTDNPSDDIVYNDSTEMSSFLPVGEKQQQEIQAVRNQLSENEPMQWPSVENEPLNEYQISHLATMAFPTLFPDGKGDPTNQGLLRDVPLQERIKHLLKFAEIIDGKWVYRFANRPRFSYWAFNMIQRKRILQQSGIFLKQNPGEAHLTIDELREIANSGNANVFMSKLSRYVGNIAGTNAYWNRVREELKAIITNVGPPTFFFTFSSADMHWPELHALFKADADNDISNSTTEKDDKMLLIILML